MIIFDLDGTLANCEHRRHFVTDPRNCGDWQEARCWHPDWKSFYEACDKDEPIYCVFKIMFNLDEPYQIWSGRCESVRDKTEKWLCKYMHKSEIPELKMRPIGDYTPDDQLKEKWLDEVIASGETVDMVFDDRKKVIEMWRSHGIFVFDVSQGKGDF